MAHTRHPVESDKDTASIEDTGIRRLAILATTIWALLLLASTYRLATHELEFSSDLDNFRPDSSEAEAQQRMFELYGEQGQPLFLHVQGTSGENLLKWNAVQEQLSLAKTIANSTSEAGIEIQITTLATILDSMAEAEGEQSITEFPNWTSFALAVDPTATCSLTGLGQGALADAAYVGASMLGSPDYQPLCEALSGTGAVDASPKSTVQVWRVEVMNSSDLGHDHDIVRDLVSELGDKNGLNIQSVSYDLLTHDVDEATRGDLFRLALVASGAIIVALAIAFRRARYVAFPFILLSTSIIMVYGILSLINAPLTVLEIAVAPLVLGLGIDFSIHLQRAADHRTEEGPGRWRNAIEELSVPLGLAAVTTVAALASSVVSPLPALRWFGLAAALGVILAFASSTIVLASFHYLHEAKYGTPVARQASKQSEMFEYHGAGALVNQRGIVIALVAILTAGSVIASTQLETTFDLSAFLDEELDVMQAREAVRSDLEAGSWRTVYLFFENEDTSSTRSMLNELRFLDGRVDTIPNTVGTSRSGVADGAYDGLWPLLQDATTELNGFGERHHMRLDGNDNLVLEDTFTDQSLIGAVNELMGLTSAGDPIRGAWSERVASVIVLDTNDIWRSTRVELLISTDDSHEDAATVSALLGLAEESGGELEGVSVHAVGDLVEQVDVLTGLTSTQLFATLIALMVSAFVLVVLTRRLWPAVVVILPVGVAATWVTGAMAIIGIDWNVLTIMVTALAIGLGIDYGIHIWKRFDMLSTSGASAEEVVRKVLNTTGSALIWSAATTVLGFAALLFSPMPVVREFGIIVGLAALSALVACLTLLPVLLLEEHLDQDVSTPEETSSP